MRSGESSATEVLDHHLARIERLNDPLVAMVHVDADGARRAAAAVDAAVAAGRDPGPLAGVPLGVKELDPVQGWPDTSASTLFRDRIATRTSTSVRRLVAAGAVPVGLTASPELGLVPFTVSLLHGVSRNPWDLERTPGGSSGGSAAAVAAGLVALATATDMGGSIRIPASFCGVVGLKPTFGLVSRGPRHVGAADLWCTGPIGRSVLDVACYLDCVVGVDELDPSSVGAPAVSYRDEVLRSDVAGQRVAFVPDAGLGPAEPGTEEVVRAACAALVAAGGLRECADVSLFAVDARSGVAPLLGLELNPEVAQRMPEVVGNLMQTEGLADVIEILAPAPGDPLAGILAALGQRRELNRFLADLFDEVDLLVMPTTGMPPFAAAGPLPTTLDGREVGPGAVPAFTVPFNLSGHPVVSVPAGLRDGLPVGMSIVGRRHHDHQVLAAAAVLEQARPWATLAPAYR